MRVAHHRTHGFGAVRPRHGQQPHQSNCPQPPCAASLLQVRPPSLTCSNFTPRFAGISDDEYTQKRSSTSYSINSFCVNSSVPNSLSRWNTQPVYQVVSPRLFMWNFVYSAAWKYLHVSLVPAVTMTSTSVSYTHLTLPTICSV